MYSDNGNIVTTPISNKNVQTKMGHSKVSDPKLIAEMYHSESNPENDIKAVQPMKHRADEVHGEQAGCENYKDARDPGPRKDTLIQPHYEEPTRKPLPYLSISWVPSKAKTAQVAKAKKHSLDRYENYNNLRYALYQSEMEEIEAQLNIGGYVDYFNDHNYHTYRKRKRNWRFNDDDDYDDKYEVEGGSGSGYEYTLMEELYVFEVDDEYHQGDKYERWEDDEEDEDDDDDDDDEEKEDKKVDKYGYETGGYQIGDEDEYDLGDYFTYPEGRCPYNF